MLSSSLQLRSQVSKAGLSPDAVARSWIILSAGGQAKSGAVSSVNVELRNGATSLWQGILNAGGVFALVSGNSRELGAVLP